MATVTLILTDATDGGWPYFRWFCSGSEEMTTAMVVALEAMRCLEGKVRVDDSKTPQSPFPETADVSFQSEGRCSS